MIDVLIINHPTKGQMRWYFEGEADEVNEQFIKARTLAEDLGICEGTEEDMLSDFYEFENCMREDGLIPQEDELTAALKNFRTAREAYDAANADVNNVIRRRDAANHELAKANEVAFRLLSDGVIKVIDGKAYVKHGSWILIKEAQ